MGKPSAIATWAVVLGTCVSGTVFAQTGPFLYVFSAGVSGTFQGGDLHLRIVFNGSYERATEIWYERPNGIDLYRRVVGIECSGFERISSQPFAFAWDPNHFYNPLNLDYVDAATSAGNAYEYMIRAVDANRNQIAANVDVSVGFVTNGETLIGRGTISTSNLCGYPVDDYWLSGCPEECLPAFMGHDAVLAPYANTGQTLSVYGQLLTGVNCEGSFTTHGTVTRLAPSVCLVGVESTTWGKVKHLYR